MPEYTTGAQNVLAEGEYNFVVADASEKESKNGNPMIELTLCVIPDGSHEGVKVFDHLVFIESAYWKIDAFRRSSGEQLVEGQKVSFEADDCIDRKGRVYIITDTYDGRTRNKVGEYLEPAAGKTAWSGAGPKQSSHRESGGGGGAGSDPDDIPFACDRG